MADSRDSGLGRGGRDWGSPRGIEHHPIDGPLSALEVDELITKAKAQALDPAEQETMGYALEFYRDAALRAERVIHGNVKRLETADKL